MGLKQILEHAFLLGRGDAAHLHDLRVDPRHHPIALIQQEELPRRSTPLNQPPMRTRSRRIQQHTVAVRVEGQIFPSLAAASAATGYTPEQIEVLGGEPELPFATVSEDRS